MTARKKLLRMQLFKKMLADAPRKELNDMEKELAKEIRLSETAIKEGFEKRK